MPDISAIREHMDVIASDGATVGKVDEISGNDRIKLTKSNDPGGKHHTIPFSWIDRVDQHVHLNKAGNDVTKNWSEVA